MLCYWWSQWNKRLYMGNNSWLLERGGESKDRLGQDIFSLENWLWQHNSLLNSWLWVRHSLARRERGGWRGWRWRVEMLERKGVVVSIMSCQQRMVVVVEAKDGLSLGMMVTSVSRIEEWAIITGDTHGQQGCNDKHLKLFKLRRTAQIITSTLNYLFLDFNPN